jgi:hypothetical protein
MTTRMNASINTCLYEGMLGHMLEYMHGHFL